MTSSRASRDPSLEDVLYAFSLEQRMPDAELLDGFVRRYPQYAEELTEFAVALVLDAWGDAPADPEKFSKDAAAALNSPEVSRAVSRFQSKLRAARAAGEASGDADVSPERANAPNPLSSLSPEEFEAAAVRLGVNNVFLCRLRDRVIDPATIPGKFAREVAEALEIAPEAVVAHFASRPEPPSSSTAFYKADKQPEIVRQQTFEQAVRASGLSEEQQKRLLSY